MNVRNVKISFTQTKSQKMYQSYMNKTKNNNNKKLDDYFHVERKKSRLNKNNSHNVEIKPNISAVEASTAIAVYSDSDSSLPKQRLMNPRVGTAKRRNKKRKEPVNPMKGVTPSYVKPRIKIKDDHVKPMLNLKLDNSSVMTSSTTKKSVYSENRKFERWDESGLHDPRSYNETIDEKYGKKPTNVELICRDFGRPSKDHSFTADVVFDHTLIFLIKSQFLAEPDVSNLQRVHPLYNHLFKVMKKTLDIDFSSLAEEDFNYDSQTEVTDVAVRKFLALAIYYNFHIGSIIRFLGRNYIAAHRKAPALIEKIRGIVPEETIEHMRKLFTTGAPMKMNGHSDRNNFLNYYDYGNHDSVDKNPGLIVKALNKEHKHKYVMAFPGWISRFVPHLHITPQGLLIKPKKNPRIIFDASIKLFYDSFCVNMATDKKNEPDIQYGDTFDKHLIRIWNLRISYPTKIIYIWDDDVAGAFRQGKYNPEIAAAFSFLIFNRLWIPCGMVFGGNTSASCFEPIAITRVYLAKHYSCPKFSHLLDKHKKILDKVKFDDESGYPTKSVQAISDSVYKGVLLEEGDTPVNTPHFMFVDDNHMADIGTNIKQAMAGSIESIFDVLGFPKPIIRRDAISWDKYDHANCSWRKQQLGLIIDTCQMIVELPEDKLDDLCEILAHWHSSRKSFTVLQIAQLLGKLEYAAKVAPWLRFLCISLRDSSIIALRRNRALVLDDKSMRHFIVDSTYRGTHSMRLLKKHFATGKIAQKIWQSKTRFFITKEMKQDILFLEHFLLHNRRVLYIPIAHWVPRDPDFSGRGDACLEGAGGYSLNLGFWWFFEWPDEIKSKTLKYFDVKIAIDKTNFISINLLEYATIIIMYAAATQAYREMEPVGHVYPIFKNESDNMSAVVWSKKASISTPAGKALAKLFAMLCIDNKLGLASAYIRGDDNIVADNISRMNTKKLNRTSNQLLNAFPELQNCRRFRPNQELISSLCFALLNGRLITQRLPSSLGQFSPVRSTG